MRVRVLVAAATLAVLVSLSAGPRTGYTQDVRAARASDIAALLRAFDNCIQDRFADLQFGRFGTARVLAASPHRFFAENVREESIVGYLERARLVVVMYVGGRRLLDESGYDITPQRGAFAPGNLFVPARRGVRLSGPAVVTPLSYVAPPPDAPRAPALQPEATRALRALDGTDATTFSMDGWDFVARPVRASTEACLACHTRTTPGQVGNQLRMGDPLGLVLYGYKQQR
jgi:hypothetical protein